MQRRPEVQLSCVCGQRSELSPPGSGWEIAVRERCCFPPGIIQIPPQPLSLVHRRDASSRVQASSHILHFTFWADLYHKWQTPSFFIKYIINPRLFSEAQLNVQLDYNIISLSPIRTKFVIHKKLVQRGPTLKDYWYWEVFVTKKSGELIGNRVEISPQMKNSNIIIHRHSNNVINLIDWGVALKIQLLQHHFTNQSRKKTLEIL